MYLLCGSLFTVVDKPAALKRLLGGKVVSYTCSGSQTLSTECKLPQAGVQAMLL